MIPTKFVEKIKTQISCPKIFSPKSYRFWDNVEKCGRSRQATDGSTAHALCMLDN